jgi:hypothetical protein
MMNRQIAGHQKCDVYLRLVVAIQVLWGLTSFLFRQLEALLPNAHGRDSFVWTATVLASRFASFWSCWLTICPQLV